jgi:hypothetical protein
MIVMSRGQKNLIDRQLLQYQQEKIMHLVGRICKVVISILNSMKIFTQEKIEQLNSDLDELRNDQDMV